MPNTAQLLAPAKQKRVKTKKTKRENELNKSYLVVGLETNQRSVSNVRKASSTRNTKTIAGRRSTEPFTGYEDTYGAANYSTIGENSIVLPPVHQSQKLPSSKKVVSDRNAAKIAQMKRKQMEELQRMLDLEEKNDEERDKMLEKTENEEERKELEVVFGKERAETQMRLRKLAE